VCASRSPSPFLCSGFSHRRFPEPPFFVVICTEQEELVRSLEQKQAHTSRRWRVRATANSRPIRLRVWGVLRWVMVRFNSIWCSRSIIILACAARLCGVPPRLRGLPRLLQLPPCLVSLGTSELLVAAP
jgi:hypothetical protein